MNPFDFHPHPRIIFGNGVIERLGEVAQELGLRHALLVADHGLVDVGYVELATRLLRERGIAVAAFHDFDVNPTSTMVEAGRAFAASLEIDSLVALGGGSSLDCAKGINFLLTNGGQMKDYLGYGKTTRPLLPMIGIPTTAGTGSEAQSYALISDAETHIKMACGARDAKFSAALLDPVLTVSQPRSVTATAGFDAIAHAVETHVTTKRNALSEAFSREAWKLLESNYERVLVDGDDLEARGAMQLGAYFAGMAIENSMLGATHACANPLTTHKGTAHGAAIAMLLPPVVRWNGPVVAARYAELTRLSGRNTNGQSRDPSETLARRLEQLAEAGGLRATLSEAGVNPAELPLLAKEAAEQWTGRFNPRPFDQTGALEVYRCVL